MYIYYVDMTCILKIGSAITIAVRSLDHSKRLVIWKTILLSVNYLNHTL